MGGNPTYTFEKRTRFLIMRFAITFETDNASDFEYLQDIGERLQLRRASHDPDQSIAESAQERLFFRLFGAWSNEESASEMTDRLRSDRTSDRREVGL
jgi:hypothetical protein